MRRIAICLNGQPRTWKKCLPGWNDIFQTWGKVDYFFHFWNYNSSSGLSALDIAGRGIPKPPTETPVSLEEQKEILDFLLPKKYVFDSKRKTSIKNPAVKNIVADFSHSQFYSLWRAVNLKRQYEIENDFEYDAVVRLRADMTSPPHFNLPRMMPSSIYSIQNLPCDLEFAVYRFCDTFFIADSLTMDHIAMFYDSFNFIDASDVSRMGTKFPPEVALYYYCAMTGIDNIILSHMDIKVMRTQEHVDKVGFLRDYETA